MCMPFLTVTEEGRLASSTTDETFPLTPDGLVRLGMAIGPGHYAYSQIESVELHKLISRGQEAKNKYGLAVPSGGGGYQMIEDFRSESLDEALSHAAFVGEGMDWVLVDGLGNVIGANRA